MNRGTRRRRAAVAIALLAVLAAALPAVTVAHDHPERPETECRICEVATSAVAVVRDGSALSVGVDLRSLLVVEAVPEVAPPVLRSGAARAPPA